MQVHTRRGVASSRQVHCPSGLPVKPLRIAPAQHPGVPAWQVQCAVDVPWHHPAASVGYSRAQRLSCAAATESVDMTERTLSSVDSVPRGETAGAILVVDNVSVLSGTCWSCAA